MGGGAVALTGTGLNYYHSTKDNFLLTRLLEFIHDIELTETEFYKFNDYFKSFISEVRYERYHTLIMLEKLTLNGKVDPLNISSRIDKWDRRLVTQFITTTDYLNNRGKNVHYIGPPAACDNPFSDFSY